MNKKARKNANKKRKLSYLKDNKEEDRVIKKLEKQLKLNKRKSKSVPKSFVSDGLDYLLEICDENTRKGVAETEKQLQFESDHDSDFLDSDVSDSENKAKKTKAADKSGKNIKKSKSDKKVVSPKKRNVSESSCTEDEFDEEISEYSEDDSDDGDGGDCRIKDLSDLDDGSLHSQNGDIESEDEQKEENFDSKDKNKKIKSNEDTWEDIYGRKRDKEGNIVTENLGKYIPPAARMKNLQQSNTAKSEHLLRLKKQLKGLLNRLAENNMHTVVSQLDELYMSNSRNDMNEMLFNLMSESLIAPVLTPDRLITEHMMCIAILHANVGTEVGAHFILALVKKFTNFIEKDLEVENKELDNLVLMISHLYNFKVFGSQLVYQILNKLAEKFTEKEIEIILLILKTVGFVLRKDDPLALKELILSFQKKAATVKSTNSRVQFMLDVLLAIKNNNMNKIPQYDPSHVEHLKKILRNLIRKGNTISQLNLSFEDLQNVDERGKWWIVGSAWSGKSLPDLSDQKNDNKPMYSQKILELAKAQRMNTDVRRNIFCILMTAEDYLDAFEKLHHLGLKNRQEREIIYVILNCCMQEKKFNPYYAVLAQKFCDYDRKYQLNIQYSLWDKIKMLNSYNKMQLVNLAKFMTYLFIHKGLPLSVLKIIEFAELDSPTMKIIKKIMLDILTHQDAELCIQAFQRVSLSEKLHHFREGLRLFISHFLLKNVKEGSLSEKQIKLIKQRAEIVDKLLATTGSRQVF